MIKTLPNHIIIWLLVGLVTVLQLGCDKISSVQLNNKGLKHLQQGEFSLAEQKFIESMAQDISEPALHANLGINYEAAKNYDKAAKEYGAILRYQGLPTEWNFVGNFNYGNAEALNKKIDSALEHYQAALDVATVQKLNSDYLKDVKNNIEVLMSGNGGGGGGGDQKNQEGKGQGQDNQNPQAGDKNKSDDGNGEQQKEQQKPKFKSENLTQEDVRKILEELKSQEKKIRAQEYGGQPKESPSGHDW